jgi:hypothetical protein
MECFKLITVRVHMTYSGTSVHKQILQAKKVSDDERCLGLRTRKLATEAS